MIPEKAVLKFIQSSQQTGYRCFHSIPRIDELIETQTNLHILNFLKAQKQLLKEIYIQQVYFLAIIIENPKLKKLCFLPYFDNFEKIDIELNHINMDILDIKLEKFKQCADILAIINLIFGLIVLTSLYSLLFAGPSILLVTGFGISIISFLLGINLSLSNNSDMMMCQAGKQALNFRFFDRDAKYNARLIDNCLNDYLARKSTNDIQTSPFPPFHV